MKNTEALTGTTFAVSCPCGCGDTVVAHDAGFAATTVEVEACESGRANGIVTLTIRKSAAIARWRPSGVRHIDGLVVLS